MKLSKQVVSLELAKRLKELGVKQESYFSWHTGGKLSGPKFEDQLLPTKRPAQFGSADSAWEDFSAFTVAELGEMLIDYSINVGASDLPNLCADGVGNIFWNWRVKDEIQHADAEADARAKMLIYLLENNLTTPT